MGYNNLMPPKSAHSHPVWSHYQAAQKVARLLHKAGFEAYLIGGAVRDIWLGYLPKDFDLVTNATPEQILKLPEIEAAKYDDPAQAFGVSRVKTKMAAGHGEHLGEVEVATYRRDIEAHLGRKDTKVEFTNLETDLQRRDFTINALALDLDSDYLVDLVGGVDDLEAGQVRFIGDPEARINEDPLRVLRGLRLRVQYKFDYEPATAAALHQAVANGSIEKVATERLRDELSRLLTHPTRRTAVEELDKFGILERVLPEVTAGKGVPQPPEFHSEGDVYRHTLLAVDNLGWPVSRRLGWATLLHDVGKPPTYQPASATGDRIRFSSHYEAGAKLAKTILGRLRFSKRFIDEVAWMIEMHIGIDDLPRMRPGRAAHLMAQPAFEDLLELHKADARASWNLLPSGKVAKPHPEFKELNRLYDEFKHAAIPPPSLKDDLGVDGAWLMRELKLPSGPKLGQILAKLEDAYLDGEIKTLEQAQTLGRRLSSTAS